MPAPGCAKRQDCGKASNSPPSELMLKRATCCLAGNQRLQLSVLPHAHMAKGATPSTRGQRHAPRIAAHGGAERLVTLRMAGQRDSRFLASTSSVTMSRAHGFLSTISIQTRARSWPQEGGPLFWKLFTPCDKETAGRLKGCRLSPATSTRRIGRRDRQAGAQQEVSSRRAAGIAISAQNR